jgi:hypothetical protein
MTPAAATLGVITCAIPIALSGCSATTRALPLTPSDIDASASWAGDVDVTVSYDGSHGLVCMHVLLAVRRTGPERSSSVWVQQLLAARVEGAKWSCIGGSCQTQVDCAAVGCALDEVWCSPDLAAIASSPGPRGRGRLVLETAAVPPARIRRIAVDCL